MKNRSLLLLHHLQQSHLLLPKEPFISALFFSSTTTPPPPPSASQPSSAHPITLTEEETAKINHLIPRLCESNHLPEAIRLIGAALLANPPLESLPIAAFIHHLASQPEMTLPMSLLNRLKHTPRTHPSLPSITHMLLSSYLNQKRLKEAIKILNWMSRPGSPCPPDTASFELVIGGLCSNGVALEALKLLRAMLLEGWVPGSELRTRLFRVLLRDARIGEAKELSEGLRSAAEDGGGDGVAKVLALLDHLIANWVD